MDNRLIVGYIRVSTTKAEQETSVINQEERLRTQGIEKLYIDKSSGTNISNRPNFIAMLSDCGLIVSEKQFQDYVEIDKYKEIKIKKIVCKSISRFGRNVVDTISIIKLLRKQNIEVYFEMEQLSTFDINCDFQLQLLAVFSEQFSRDTSSRVRSGMEISKSKGKFVSFKTYGYTYNRNTNKVELDEYAPMVEIIFNLALKLGCRKIANYINDKTHYRRKDGSKWTVDSIRAILKNEIYTGYTIRNKYYVNTIEKVVKENDKSEWIYTQNIPAIISKELFNQVQEIKHDRFTGKISAQSTKRPYSNRKVVCAYCNSAFVYNVSKDYSYLVCGYRKRYGTERCDNRIVRLEEVDNYVDYSYRNYHKESNDNSVILSLINRTKELINDIPLNDVRSQLESLKNKVNNLLDLDITADMKPVIEAKINAINEEMKMLKAKEDEDITKQDLERLEIIKNKVEEITTISSKEDFLNSITIIIDKETMFYNSLNTELLKEVREIYHKYK